MSRRVLVAEDLCKHFDGVCALDRFSISVERGEVVGLIGPNGAGKTTLFNVLSGMIRADEGRATFLNTNLLATSPHRISQAGVSRTFQILRLIGQITVLDNVCLAIRDQPGEQLANVFVQYRKCRLADANNQSRAMQFLVSVGLQEYSDHNAASLSYGQQKLLSIVMCLATDAELLLLDEPISGIAPDMRETILAIIRHLSRKGKSAIVIEHDMEAIESLCSRVVFMEAGKKICEGSPEEVRDDPRVIEAYME